MIRLSFVIPCYNVERFVLECLDSIFSCDIPENEYEVICVNDCSTDETGQILNNRLSVHPNLRVINLPVNKGPGAARNAGIKEARGTFLWFIDADDFISGQRLNAIIKEAAAVDVDVLCFNYRKTDEGGKELSTYNVFSKVSPINGYSFVNTVFGSTIVFHMGYAVRFIFKVDYLKSRRLLFPEGVIWEDTVYMPKALLKASRVASIPDILYSYRTNPASISNIYIKSYPAKLIYDWSFVTGKELLDFSDEVEDSNLKEAFKRSAINKYINGFSLLLFRTNQSERKAFYKIVKKARKEVDIIRGELTPINRLLLSPVGFPIASIGAIIYKFTHRKRYA